MIILIDVLILLLTFIYVLAKRYTYRALCWFLLSLLISLKMGAAGKISVAIVMAISTVLVFLLTEVYGLSSEKFWEKMKEADNFTRSKVVIALLLSLIVGAVSVISLNITSVELNTFWSTPIESTNEVLSFSFISIFTVMCALLIFNKREEK